MQFVAKFSEYTFYDNLFLGLAKALYKSAGVHASYLHRNSSVVNSDICLWENKHGILLAEDLRAFFTSTNGVLFLWNFSFADDAEDKILSGKVEINSMETLTQVFGYETCKDPGVKMDSERYILKLSLESKLYELVAIEGVGRVVLVYLNPKFSPTIWLMTAGPNFYFLADNFTTYMRMAVAHLGIPYWQFIFTPQGVPEWTENMFRILAPHLLPLDKKIEMMRKEREKRKDEDYSDMPINKLDPNLFKVLPRPPPQQSQLQKDEISEANKVKPTKKKQLEKQRPGKFQRKPLYYIKRR